MMRGYEELCADNPREAAKQWFDDADFGLFIHYGLYSLAEGYWGDVHSKPAEWVQLRAKVPVKEYEKLADKFTAENFDADFITDLAVDAGMKYINITTRHHDSFCLFDTKYTEFNSVNSAANRDLLAELAEQCEKKGLGLFFYYSFGRDWRHPHAPDNAHFKGSPRPEYDPPEASYKYGDDHDVNLYVEFMKNQITELLTNYGPVAGIWLDGRGVMKSPGAIERLRVAEIYDHIWALQPQTLVSFKQGVLGTEDFKAPERHYKREGDELLEICNTMQPYAWGYDRDNDVGHKTPDEVMELLAHTKEMNANLLLNIGPLPDGTVFPDDVTSLREVGKRLKKQKELEIAYEHVGVAVQQKGTHVWGTSPVIGKDGTLTVEEAKAFQNKQRRERRKKVTIPPTHADVAYGPHPHNVLDLWLVPSDTPTPLLVFIHGGGFRGGDKRNFDNSLIQNMHKEGISVASINYRLTERGLLADGENMYPAPMHDGARALQFLRYNASKYNLDKAKFAATGGSAGGCMLMWLGFYPDLAQPDHKDPVLRESSRLQVLAPRGGQSCVHGPTLLKWFGVKSLNLSKQKGVVQSSSEVKQPTAKQLALGLDASPITHLTPDDPPIYLLYNGPNEPVDDETPWGTWVHHPMFGIKLKEAMELYLGMECHLEYKDGPPVTEYESQQDFIIRKLKSLPKDAIKGNPQAGADGDSTLTEEEEAKKWKTTGFKQANTMGGGQAAISKRGKFRVFVLMGQSNMQGAGRAKELKAPYNEKHDRIRIWANGRWEYFVPSQRFGPGVSFAHQLADFWPDDTIGIIKVAVGGTGICGFEKNWSFERAELTWDGKKGPLYKDLMNAVAEAKRISNTEFCGFFWKQGAADGTKKVLANAYYDRFRQLVSDLRADLGVSDLPTFVPVYMKDEELLKALLS
ncbi:MAG: alpha-L-fucosidase, partial [Planctomycetota bacterium]